jgi:hypothetical protein
LVARFLLDVRCDFGSIVGNAINEAHVARWLIVPVHRQIPFRFFLINPKAS